MARHPWVEAHRETVGFGIQLAMTPDPGLNRSTAEAIEGLGFDALFTPDHPIIGFDAWTQLAVLAQVTRRIRLGTLVSCASYKNPGVLLARHP